MRAYFKRFKDISDPLGRISKRELDSWTSLIGIMYYIWFELKLDLFIMSNAQHKAICLYMKIKRARREKA